MNGADWFDLLTEMDGPRAKHAIGVTFMVGMVVVPTATIGVLEWYAHERAHEVVQQIEIVGPSGRTSAPDRAPQPMTVYAPAPVNW